MHERAQLLKEERDCSLKEEETRVFTASVCLLTMSFLLSGEDSRKRYRGREKRDVARGQHEHRRKFHEHQGAFNDEQQDQSNWNRRTEERH